MPPSQAENVEAPINNGAQDDRSQPSREAWDTMREQSKSMSQNAPKDDSDVQELEFSDPFAAETERKDDKEKNPKDMSGKAEPEEDFLWGEHGDNPSSTTNSRTWNSKPPDD